MAFENEPFSIRRGNDRLIDIEVFDDAGGAVDLSVVGTKIRLTYGITAGGPPLKTITEASLAVSGNKATYRMRPDESSSLEAYRTYWFECLVAFPDGQDGFRDTVTTGSFTVDPSQG